MKKSFKEKVKLITIARRLACNSGYCPDYEEAKKYYKEEIDFKVSEEELREACDENEGRREDEISNYLDRLFIK